MRERLKEKLAEVWPELDDRRRSGGRRRGARAVRRARPQIAFLDIRMPGRTGLEVAAAIGGDCHVVFITAYDQYALAAFEAGAVDYLLKPVETDRLAQTVERVQRKLASAAGDLSALVAQLRARGARRRAAAELDQGGGRQAGEADRRSSDVIYFQTRHEVHARRARAIARR